MKFIFFVLLPVLAFAKSLEEKVGDLFIIPVCPKRERAHWDEVKALMEKYHISSVIVKQATPEEQLEMLAFLGDGVFVFQDAEWGLGMRMENTPSFPKNGFLKDEALVYRIGKEIARELRIVGCHVNLSPVCDVNSNPNNVIIGLRSFGKDPEKVAILASEMAKGLQDGGILACGKHFPGHGDVAIDSHISLPIVLKTKEELNKIEFIPFQKVIDEGIGAIMTAHVKTPNLEEHPIKILRHEMQFSGLVISDALNMGGVLYPPDEAALIYIKNGYDLLLYGDHIAPNVDYILQEMIPKAYNALLSALEKDEIVIEESLQRINEAKKKWLKPKESGALITSETEALLKHHQM
ncbi:MAG: hypothetical protein FJZ59_00795 [Chlamydiae bacterium]|jgi:beta-glucosidase-like glycosyl hydrolase|nr:hypothetical protein [Chlamydiota bacterium]